MKNITYISASAGSGKTYELTERLKKVILEGKAKPEEVILTTFTKASASEFKEKAKAKFYEVGKVKEAKPSGSGFDWNGRQRCKCICK